MKLQLPDKRVELANAIATHECTITTGPKMFDILIRQYGDPIKAMIRELACNAADSHLEAGKDDVPFLVTLIGPDDSHITQQSYLWIRDFGVGMSHE